jgi:glutaminase
MEVNCETIAVIAATFAKGGVCPITKENVVAPEVCRDVLSLLHSCGFYEYSGQFAFKVRKGDKTAKTSIREINDLTFSIRNYCTVFS